MEAKVVNPRHFGGELAKLLKVETVLVWESDDSLHLGANCTLRFEMMRGSGLPELLTLQSGFINLNHEVVTLGRGAGQALGLRCRIELGDLGVAVGETLYALYHERITTLPRLAA